MRHPLVSISVCAISLCMLSTTALAEKPARESIDIEMPSAPPTPPKIEMPKPTPIPDLSKNMPKPPVFDPNTTLVTVNAKGLDKGITLDAFLAEAKEEFARRDTNKDGTLTTSDMPKPPKINTSALPGGKPPELMKFTPPKPPTFEPPAIPKPPSVEVVKP